MWNIWEGYMSLKLYNTMGRKIEDFIPIKENSVGFYGCGPTVYKAAHIGNLRAYVFQDILARSLKFLGYDVKHVMNITDIGHLSDDGDDGEDKMLKSARESGLKVNEIADMYIDLFFKDVDSLNIKRPSVICRATEHISDMIELIKKIEKNGHTYMSEGNLYFDISTFPDYGKLSGVDIETLKPGARIEVDKNKKNPNDFVLWFTKSKFENQALVWDSPWGTGYPGWHIECSAMSMKYLGEQFDIHTGGIDHVRIHHTNEIAQSEGATGKKWVNYWLHNEFLVMNKGKMSKSEGNFITLEKVIEAGYAPLDYRFLLLGGHYRSQLTFSWEAMETAKNARRNLEQRIAHILKEIDMPACTGDTAAITRENARAMIHSPEAHAYLDNFTRAMEEDISTPRALSVVQNLVKDKTVAADEVYTLIVIFDTVLGLNLIEEALSRKPADESDNDEEIERLIAERAAAKQQKNFSKADEIRNLLKEQGVIVEDTASGTIWRKV